MLKRVGLDPTLMRRFPHQFSGGQRARIGIARALAVKPEFLVCDEAVAALDVSIQAQVLNLFMDSGRRCNLTYLFISHDLGVVEHICRPRRHHVSRPRRRAGADRELFAAPNHPYTQALLAEVGKRRAKKRTFVPIKGEIPSPLDPPSGLPFSSALPARDGAVPMRRRCCARSRRRPAGLPSERLRRVHETSRWDAARGATALPTCVSPNLHRIGLTT